MPTYEYQCQNCGYEVEYFHSITEAPRTECPRCSGQLKRKVSRGGGLIFKGKGFYITDYKRRGEDGSSTEGGSRATANSKTTTPAKAVADD